MQIAQAIPSILNYLRTCIVYVYPHFIVRHTHTHKHISEIGIENAVHRSTSSNSTASELNVHPIPRAMVVPKISSKSAPSVRSSIPETTARNSMPLLLPTIQTHRGCERASATAFPMLKPFGYGRLLVVLSYPLPAAERTLFSPRLFFPSPS